MRIKVLLVALLILSNSFWFLRVRAMKDNARFWTTYTSQIEKERDFWQKQAFDEVERCHAIPCAK